MFIPVEQRPEISAIDLPPAVAVTPIAEIMARHPEPAPVETPEVTEELLIEEVSIDGMCGVY